MASRAPIRGAGVQPVGTAGWCAHCDQWVDDGPDACLGTLPDVAEACCGHGDPSRAYVTYTNGVHVYGRLALVAMGQPTWP